jgi:hypothetical protein
MGAIPVNELVFGLYLDLSDGIENMMRETS